MSIWRGRGTSRRTLLRGVVALGAAGTAACGAGEQAQPKAATKLPAVVVWASNTGQADLPYFERFAKWFEEKNAGTKVDLVLPPGEGGYETKMIAMFAAGTYPDVFHLHFHIVPRHSGDGQDVVWKTHPELREDFDEMLARLK